MGTEASMNFLGHDLRLTLKRQVRTICRRHGLDFQRYPDCNSTARIVALLAKRGVTLVLDVGGNTGGFARTIREAGYRGRIVSFEPLSSAFAELSNYSARDRNWDVHHVALGAHEGNVTMNVAGNSSSSSVLPMLDRHASAAPTSCYVGTETVPLNTLDNILRKIAPDQSAPIFLKIDVQGYESAVMDGAQELLHSDRLIGVQLEVSFEHLYEGAPSWRELFDRMEALSLALTSIEPMFLDPVTGQILQADAVWLKH